MAVGLTGKDFLPSSFVWLLAGFSSLQASINSLWALGWRPPQVSSHMGFSIEHLTTCQLVASERASKWLRERASKRECQQDRQQSLIPEHRSDIPLLSLHCLMETSHCVQSKLKSITSLGAMSEDAYIFLVTIRGILPLHSRPHFILQDSASHSVIPEPVASLGNLL